VDHDDDLAAGDHELAEFLHRQAAGEREDQAGGVPDVRFDGVTPTRRDQEQRLAVAPLP